MKKWTMFVVFSSLSLTVCANEVVKPINNLFDAMRNHDGDKLLAQFTVSAKLQRAMQDGTVKDSDVAAFGQSIAQAKAALDEQLLDVKISQSDNLASVWTPYAFYLDGKLSHCGVNSFQLVNTEAGWKIQHLIDNSHPGDCQEFIRQHQRNG